MRFTPLSRIVIVEPFEVEEMMMDGLKVPDTVAAFIPPQQGEVVAVGRSVRGIEVGDRVLYGLEVGMEFAGLVFLKENEIVCGIEA